MTLSELRKKKGKTQKSVAEALNVSERTIKAWEATSRSLNSNKEHNKNKNLKYPSIDNIIEIARLLELQPLEIYECFSNASDNSIFNKHELANDEECVTISDYLSRLAGSERERILSGIISNGQESFQFTNYKLNEIPEEDFFKMISSESITINNDIWHNGLSPYKGILFFDNNNHFVYLDNKDPEKMVKYNKNSFGITFSFSSSRNILTGEMSNMPIPFQIIFLYASIISTNDNPLIVAFDKVDKGSDRLGKILKYKIKNDPGTKAISRYFNKDKISRLINGKIFSYNDITQVKLITGLTMEELFEIYSNSTLEYYAKFKKLKIGYNSYFANISNGKDVIEFIKYCNLANEAFGNPLIMYLYETVEKRKFKLCNTKFHVSTENDILILSSDNEKSIKINSNNIIKIESLESEYSSKNAQA